MINIFENGELVFSVGYITYFSGFIFAYFMWKVVDLNLTRSPWEAKGRTWSGVMVSLFCGIFSWIGFIIALIIFICIYDFDSKPNKFL